MSMNMSSTQRLLWSRLESFTIGDPAASLGFAQRLARDNGWPLAFARRTIDEYKRFLFLAMEAGHPVTPSDEVDQAWHLHLVYTESYWNELCREILPRPLHHGPTKGGKREGDKFNDWYSRTLRSYQRFFGHAPPGDVWPDASIRFGRAPHFRRVNAAEHWIIRKPALRGAAGVAAFTALPSLALIGCGVGLAQNGSGIPNGLIAIIVVIGGAVTAIGLLALLVGRTLSRSGRPRPDQGGTSGCSGFWGLGDSGTDHGKSGCASHGGKSGCGSHHTDGGHSGHDGGAGSDGGSGCSGSDGGGGSGCGGGGCGGGGCGGS